MKFPYGSLAPALFSLTIGAGAFANQDGSDWRFSVQQVTRVEVSVDWPDTAPVRERSIRATLARRSAQFEGGGLAIDDDVIARIGAQLQRLAPSLGLEHCEDVQEDRQRMEIHHPEIGLAIELTG